MPGYFGRSMSNEVIPIRKDILENEGPGSCVDTDPREHPGPYRKDPMRIQDTGPFEDPESRTLLKGSRTLYLRRT